MTPPLNNHHNNAGIFHLHAHVSWVQRASLWAYRHRFAITVAAGILFILYLWELL